MDMSVLTASCEYVFNMYTCSVFALVYVMHAGRYLTTLKLQPHMGKPTRTEVRYTHMKEVVSY